MIISSYHVALKAHKNAGRSDPLAVKLILLRAMEKGKRLTSGERLVLIALASLMTSERTAVADNAELMNRTGIGRDQLSKRVLPGLIEKGIIARWDGPQTSQRVFAIHEIASWHKHSGEIAIKVSYLDAADLEARAAALAVPLQEWLTDWQRLLESPEGVGMSPARRIKLIDGLEMLEMAVADGPLTMADIELGLEAAIVCDQQIWTQHEGSPIGYAHRAAATECEKRSAA